MSKNPSFDWRKLPDLDDLPEVEGMPKGCAWGIFGEKDQLGTLNLLTPENTAKVAKQEIQTGERVQIDWALDAVRFPMIGRKEFVHKMIDLEKTLGVVATDDEISLNTQTSTQWDGFRHVAHQGLRVYYNGLTHDQLHQPGGRSEGDSGQGTEVGRRGGRNGIHHWVESGGIVGRGILLDWLGWYEKTFPDRTPPSPVSDHSIPLSELLECAKYQRTEIRAGDILLIRSGVIKWYAEADDESRRKAFSPESLHHDCGAGGRDQPPQVVEEGGEGSCKFIGVEQTEEMKRWLWNSHFSAVAGDAPGFEVIPYKNDLWLHEWLLPMWGCPIGELFDLEELAETCKRHGRWSFFFTSAPSRVTGGVASSCNAIAIF
ncbi:hypothetical protein IE53DRAFT_388806 [Violaceomyces palustris]|uniref:Uncharacterized protein n=1 Tax=Violaceomyces palustris TaxID=1673888 RepID=A0ACD0NT50_9BASI|nr:hypothetical protein IE53DRAFT_388806 [Violaceomyces palustris]